MIWSDASGKFRIEARLIGRDQTHVTLLKEDGSEIKVPIEKLSPSLQTRLNKQAAKAKEFQNKALVRVDDEIEVRDFGTWYPATVTKILPTGAEVTYPDSSFHFDHVFTYENMRYPNGEGPWREWADLTKETQDLRALPHPRRNPCGALDRKQKASPAGTSKTGEELAKGTR